MPIRNPQLPSSQVDKLYQKRKIGRILVYLSLCGWHIVAETFYYYGKRKRALIPIDHVFVVGSKAKIDEMTPRSGILPSGEMSPDLLKSFPKDRITIFSRPRPSIRGLARKDLEKSIMKNPNTAFVSRAFRDRNTGSVVYLTDEITVRFKEGISKPTIKQILQKHDLTERNKDEYVENQYILKVKDPNGNKTLHLANKLAIHPAVLFSEPNFLFEVEKLSPIPNDTRYFNKQWHLQNTGQQRGAPGEDVKALNAWTICPGGNSNAVIAIIDDGVDTNHEDLRDNILKDGSGNVIGKNFYDEEDDPDNPNPRYTDDLHGTPCGGIAAAAGNSVIGVAYDCKILAVKALGPSGGVTSNKCARAIRYAGRYADVLSCSWGNVGQTMDLDLAIHDVVTRGRAGKGCVVLFAAGNGDPTTRTGRPDVRYPAKHPDSIAVGASTNEGYKAAYSDFGPKLEFLAPSSGGTLGIFTTDVSIRGMDIDAGSPNAADPEGKYTNSFGLTSSATPLAAGIAALVISVNPGLTSGQVRNILRESCDKIDSSRANYDSNGFSLTHGYGRINAERAVELAQRSLGGQGPPLLRHYEKTRTQAIPDNDSTGISSSLVVNVDGSISDIKVGLDVRHSYIGDLRVTLESPSGVSVRLHDHSGASQDDLSKEYSRITTPSLSSLIGQSPAGTWKLKVNDNSNGDQGKLLKWYIDVASMAGVSGRSRRSVTIPDNSTAGATSTINMTGNAIVKDIRVEVEITHSYVGQLTITLTSPRGMKSILRDRTGGSADNFKDTYNITNCDELKKMINEPVRGNWKLHVKDLVQHDRGKLNSWSIVLNT